MEAAISYGGKKYEWVQITVGGVLHVSFRRDLLVGIQSWMHEQAEFQYMIEYTFSSGATLLTEYDTHEKWEQVLRLLAEV